MPGLSSPKISEVYILPFYPSWCCRYWYGPLLSNSTPSEDSTGVALCQYKLTAFTSLQEECLGVTLSDITSPTMQEPLYPELFSSPHIHILCPFKDAHVINGISSGSFHRILPLTGYLRSLTWDKMLRNAPPSNFNILQTACILTETMTAMTSLGTIRLWTVVFSSFENIITSSLLPFPP